MALLVCFETRSWSVFILYLVIIVFLTNSSGIRGPKLPHNSGQLVHRPLLHTWNNFSAMDCLVARRLARVQLGHLRAHVSVTLRLLDCARERQVRTVC